MDDIWIFAYGSLMWRPDFPFVARRAALLHGYHRAFCIYSTLYRGTPETPGLVLGLNFGGSCRGCVYRVRGRDATAVIDYLDARELVYGVYERRTVPLTLDCGRVAATAYVVNRANPQYAGDLPLDETVALILQGHGQSGACKDYLESTVRHLDEMGIPDKPLHHLWRAVKIAKSSAD